MDLVFKLNTDIPSMADIQLFRTSNLYKMCGLIKRCRINENATDQMIRKCRFSTILSVELSIEITHMQSIFYNAGYLKFSLP